MRIVVCVKPDAAGQINPFEASAYEAALRMRGAEIILLSMAPPKAKDFLSGLTRLGASEAYLLCDPAFAGSDTLATTYVLSLALQRLNPDLVFCGRQTLEGDTAQVGPALSCRLGFSFLGSCMSQPQLDDAALHQITADLRTAKNRTALLPALLTFERILDLRMPSIRSKIKPVTLWSAADLQADISRCGSSGSPTQVIRSFENTADRRTCRMIAPADFLDVLHAALEKPSSDASLLSAAAKTNVMTAAKTDVASIAKNAVEVLSQTCPEAPSLLEQVWITNELLRPMAETVGKNVVYQPLSTPEAMAEAIRRDAPDAVLFSDRPEAKVFSAVLATLLETGLCADCIRLETDGHELFMYRPAFGGNVTAKLRCKTKPAMATVRTADEGAQIVLGLGMGAKNALPDLLHFAQQLGAEPAASRSLVDSGALPYPYQVGLTGRIISPKVYIACGISGAVHHIVGIRRSGTIIAVNPDRFAPVFSYADYGIVADAEDLLRAVHIQ